MTKTINKKENSKIHKNGDNERKYRRKRENGT